MMLMKNDSFNHWLAKFIVHVRAILDTKPLTEEGIAQNLHAFMLTTPPPKLNPWQYYGFSKLLLEKLLFKSARSRIGHIYIIRPALIIGGDQRLHRGNSIIKNMLATLFANNQHYDVWSRTNYYTPINKLKAMMYYLAESEDEFAKFGIF